MLLFVRLKWSQADYKAGLYTSPQTATVKWYTTFRSKFFILQVAGYVKEAGEQSQLPWILAREKGYYEPKRKSLEYCRIETSVTELQEINLKGSIRKHAIILKEI